MLKTHLVIPDAHVPYHDEKAYQTMLKICKPLNIASVHLVGDFGDCYGVSDYDKNPDLGDLAELYLQEMLQVNEKLDELSDLFPKAEKNYCEGNHEFRLNKFIYKNAPALRKSLSYQSQIRMDQRKDWNWHPFTPKQASEVKGANGLYVRHCPFSSGSLQANAIKAGDSFIFGHTHHLAYDSFTTKLSGRKIYAINAGWLGDENAPVFDYVKSRPDWGKGFVLVHSIEGEWDFDLVQIGEKYTRFNGKIY